MSIHTDPYTSDLKPVKQRRTRGQATYWARQTLLVSTCLLLFSLLLYPVLPATQAQNQMSYDFETGELEDPGSTHITGSSFTLLNGDFTFELELNDTNFEETWMSNPNLLFKQVIVIFNNPLLPTHPIGEFFWWEDKEGNMQLNARWDPDSGFSPPLLKTWDGVEWRHEVVDIDTRVEEDVLIFEGPTPEGIPENIDVFGVAIYELTFTLARVDTFGWDPIQGVASLQITEPPRATSTLSLSEVPMLVNMGDKLSVTAIIDPPRSAVPVQLTLYAPNGTIITLQALTGENGNVIFEQVFQHRSDIGGWSMDVTWDGDDEYSGADSGPRQFTVDKPTREVSLDPVSSDVGINVEIPFTFTGKTNPPRGGVPVKLYYNGPEGQTQAFDVTTEEDGTFSHQISFPDESGNLGDWTVHAVVDGDDEYYGSQSEPLSFDVGEPPPGVPGFPLESILIGLALGLSALALLNRKRTFPT